MFRVAFSVTKWGLHILCYLTTAGVVALLGAMTFELVEASEVTEKMQEASEIVSANIAGVTGLVSGIGVLMGTWRGALATYQGVSTAIAWIRKVNEAMQAVSVIAGTSGIVGSALPDSPKN